MLKTFDIAELKPGMMVSKIVSQHGPVKIRKVGMIRSPEMIKGLTEMGVTQVEVDLAQSVGINEEEVEASESSEPLKLTPTQQLLKKERQTLSVNAEQSHHYNRSLFMPSLDSLPSVWTLYGKNISILLLLIVGGITLGWNVASIPHWLSSEKNKGYSLNNDQMNMSGDSLTISNREANANAALNSEQSLVSSQLASDNSSSSSIESNMSDSNSYMVGSANAPSNQSLNQASTQISNNDPLSEDKTSDNTSDEVVQSEQTSEPEEQPLVLGYQRDNITDIMAADQLSGSQSDSQNNATDPAVTAALLNKINQAIAELDEKSTADDPLQQKTNYDDLPRIDQLSVALQTQIPSMSFSAHMYSSSRDGRWVRVNGRRLVEGDYIAEDLQLVNIEPQKVILMFKDEVFSMSALTDW